ncbi:LptF/LptG family permease [Flavobacterium akiainvivens]|uniref:LptF/LptG family permease n=1 Tax=Flavobacterium akiainvivens TaxID=1202724 RepID=UPI0008E85F9E|nr:LptF/LptG family permease [Flavobacterium akiainvivens]SFQ66306.1 lipopolysaccharide export system permease protein [Flavobacterium akiainvivens]
MKILDRYILTSFIKTFLSAFTILFFIFVLQAIWLFIAELAGKDLGILTIIKFLAFYAPKIVPLVLPLSILLASIMTFGAFAENYEFAAMKSSGISLRRAMHSLTVFIVLLSIVSYFFANNVIPQAEYKFLNLRNNIIHKQPALAIVEGQFNPVGEFNIRVEKKSGNDGEHLTNVTIHKRRPGSVNVTVIKSKTGLLKSVEKENMLQLELFDGYYYEEITTKKIEDRSKEPFAKSSFTRQVMNIDLSQLNTDNLDDEQISQTNNMLTAGELNYVIDSLQKNYNDEVKSVAENLANRPGSVMAPIRPAKTDTIVVKKNNNVPANLIDVIEKADRARVFDLAANNISSVDYLVSSNEQKLLDKIKNINKHVIALHEKYVIAYACLLMFFIGAPLGAIIRKGGLGLPIVFAVLIFIVYHFVNTFGKKLAQENGISPFLGSWMSSFVLTPLAVLFSYRATNDLGVSINFDWLITPLTKLFTTSKPAPPPVINLATVHTEKGNDWDELNAMEDDELIALVRNSKQRSFTYKYRIKLLKILDGRGITQEQLKDSGNLYNEDYDRLLIYSEKYNLSANLALIAYAILIAGVGIWLGMPGFIKNKTLAIMGLVSVAIFYFSLFRAVQQVNRVSRIVYNHKKVNLIFALLLGLPFYIIFYFINKRAVKQAFSQYNS